MTGQSCSLECAAPLFLPVCTALHSNPRLEPPTKTDLSPRNGIWMVGDGNSLPSSMGTGETAQLNKVLPHSQEGLKKNCTGSLSDTRGGPEKRYTKRVQEILSCQIYYFDKGIGDAIEELCPDSSLLDDEQARNLVNTTKNVFQRALFGSTLAVALLDDERNHL